MGNLLLTRYVCHQACCQSEDTLIPHSKSSRVGSIYWVDDT